MYVFKNSYLSPFLATPFSCQNVGTQQCHVNTLNEDECMKTCTADPYCDYGFWIGEVDTKTSSVCSLYSDSPLEESSKYVLYNLRKTPVENGLSTVFYKKDRLNTPVIHQPLDNLFYLGQFLQIGATRKDGTKQYFAWNIPASWTSFQSNQVFPLEWDSHGTTMQITQMFLNPTVISKPLRYGEPCVLTIPNSSLIMAVLQDGSVAFVPAEKPLRSFNQFFMITPVDPNSTDIYVDTTKGFYLQTFGSKQYVAVKGDKVVSVGMNPSSGAYVYEFNMTFPSTRTATYAEPTRKKKEEKEEKVSSILSTTPGWMWSLGVLGMWLGYLGWTATRKE